MTLKELRDTVDINRDNCEEMAKLTIDTLREQYWFGCADALKVVLQWIDETRKSNNDKEWRKIRDVHPVDFRPQNTEESKNLIPGKPAPEYRIVTREQVEKMRGEWRSIPSLLEYYCSRCGEEFVIHSYDKDNYRFCPYCMAPMTEEAVDILWKLLEEMQDDTGRSD